MAEVRHPHVAARRRTRPEPIDPDSPRGRELARDLTILLDEFEENIAARKHAAQAAAGGRP